MSGLWCIYNLIYKRIRRACFGIVRALRTRSSALAGGVRMKGRFWTYYCEVAKGWHIIDNEYPEKATQIAFFSKYESALDFLQRVGVKA